MKTIHYIGNYGTLIYLFVKICSLTPKPYRILIYYSYRGIKVNIGPDH